MRIFEKSFDPMTGVTTTIGAEDGKLIVKSDQDVGPSLEYTKNLRNADEYSRGGIKRGLWHTVHIPDVVALKMKLEDGFDIYATSARELRQFLSRNRDKYGYLFVTEGKV